MSRPAVRDVRVESPRDLPGLTIVHGREVEHALARHIHSSFCVTCVLRGTRRLALAGRDFLVRAGRLMVVPPGQPHSCASAGGPYSYLSLCVAPTLLARLPETDNLAFPRPVPDDPELFQLWLSLAEPGDDLWDRTQRAMAALSRHGLQANTPLPGTHPAVRRALERIEADPAEALSQGELAALAGLSPQRLNRVFSRQLGLPPHAFRTLCRLRLARALLRSGVEPARVAQETGFHDQSHLHRAMLRFIGLTPGAFQRLHLRKE